MKPGEFYFENDGAIPNNALPLLLYRSAFHTGNKETAGWLINRFSDNNWTNAWKNGVFSYHHYHSTSHEVLGVCSGSAKLQLGGERGELVEAKAGVVIVIPAGVGHKNSGSSPDFLVVGAYPKGRSHDMNVGKADERPQADENISKVPIPNTDPLLGKNEGVPVIWDNQHQD